MGGINNRHLFFSPGSWEVQDQIPGPLSSWWEHSSWFADSCLLTVFAVGRERTLPDTNLIRVGLYPFGWLCGLMDKLSDFGLGSKGCRFEFWPGCKGSVTILLPRQCRGKESASTLMASFNLVYFHTPNTGTLEGKLQHRTYGGTQLSP